mmetsp:Transcript_16505/g.46550  ORF Transcript_16505/g.46550 Transcript_16505/m.46550 type:complete len:336 (+) Transcript_16505:287-1294(+)
MKKDKIFGLWPPVPDKDGFYRYRQGRVDLTNKLFNTLVGLPAVVVGSAYLVSFLTWGLGISGLGEVFDFGDWVHIIVLLACAILFTVAGYYAACRHVERRFYDQEATRQESEAWKVKPYMWLSPELRQEEVRWGCFNAALGSACGMGLFLLQQHPATPAGIIKIYYDIHDPAYSDWMAYFGGGWPYYILSTVWFFFVIDIWAYVAHRFLHVPFVYKNIHKWHHRYRAVSPFGAYAMHPLEFLLLTVVIQLAGVLVVPVHVAALATNLIYVGHHAIIDHSGVDFDGLFLWSPSAAFHDGHHTFYHCSFGQSLVLWDWLGGTLRRTGKGYGEKNFHD